jgi:hypothetical protein
MSLLASIGKADLRHSRGYLSGFFRFDRGMVHG